MKRFIVISAEAVKIRLCDWHIYWIFLQTFSQPGQIVSRDLQLFQENTLFNDIYSPEEQWLPKPEIGRYYYRLLLEITSKLY